MHAIHFLFVLLSLAQPAPTTTIQGRVVDENGAPIANARVAVVSADLGAAIVLTDDDGRFAIAVGRAATSLAVGKAGFGRTVVAASNGEGAIEVRLTRGAALSGHVVDEFGDAVFGARVMAHLPTSGADDPGIGTAVTDERGEYRLGGLASGSYVVSVDTSGAPIVERIGNGVMARPSFKRTYYADATAREAAEPIRLQPGDDLPKIDFAVAGGRSLGFINLTIGSSPMAQPPQPKPGERATAIVRGQLTTVDGRGVPRAQLRFSSAADPRQMLFGGTDADGRFEFGDLPPGKYLLFSAKPGFTPPPAPQAIEVAEGETRERVAVTLTKWGSIAGRIVDERGDPLQGANVQTLRVRFERGRRRLVAEGAAIASDDMGRFRIYNVPPGQFVVSASAGSIGSNAIPGYARSFYPGTPNAGQAQFVTVGPSQDITGIDLALSRTRTARIMGRMLNSAGEPTTGGNVMLLPSQTSTSPAFVGAGARITTDGQFEFTNVVPGQYVIQASRGRKGLSFEDEFGTLPVSVDGSDVTGLTLRTSAGSSIQGRFTFDTREPSKRPGRALELSPVPVDVDLSPASTAIADIHDDWTFDIGGVNGPRRLQLTRVAPGWTLKEIRVNGIDATDRALPFGRADQSLGDVEVVLTDVVNELGGTIGNEVGDPLPGSFVVVFPTDRTRWYAASRFLRTAAAGAGGAFSIAGLPFGTYYAAAVPQLPPDGPDAWQDPEYLNALRRRATTVTVRDGEKQAIRLRTSK
jgi:Carboxypeptidase regulatory-like domain